MEAIIMDKYDKLRAIIESIENDHPDVLIETGDFSFGRDRLNRVEIDVAWPDE
jgi:hypothetical protein